MPVESDLKIWRMLESGTNLKKKIWGLGIFYLPAEDVRIENKSKGWRMNRSVKMKQLTISWQSTYRKRTEGWRTNIRVQTNEGRWKEILKGNGGAILKGSVESNPKSHRNMREQRLLRVS